MIDTDKYEGHTEGPWQFDGIECVSGCGLHPTEEPVFATLHVDEEFMLTEENMLANGKLIADAPLLLEEVKRLDYLLDDSRAELKRLYEEVDSLEIAIASMQKEIKQLREAFITAVRHVGEHDLSRDDLFSKLDEDLFSYWLLRSEKE